MQGARNVLTPSETACPAKHIITDIQIDDATQIIYMREISSAKHCRYSTMDMFTVNQATRGSQLVEAAFPMSSTNCFNLNQSLVVSSNDAFSFSTLSVSPEADWIAVANDLLICWNWSAT